MAKLTPEERAELEARLKDDTDDEEEDFGEIAILRGPGVKKFLQGILGEPSEAKKDEPPAKDPKPPTRHKYFS
jgi:hypothetical protein